MGEEPSDGDASVPDEQNGDPGADSPEHATEDGSPESEAGERRPDRPADGEDAADGTSDDENSPPKSYRPYQNESHKRHTDRESAEGSPDDDPADGVGDGNGGGQPVEASDPPPEPTDDAPPADPPPESATDRMHPEAEHARPKARDDAPESPPANGVAAENPDDAARTDGSHAGSDVGVAGTGGVADEPGGGPPSGEVGIDQPPDDEEMPLADHVEEMINRLAIVLFAASVVTVAAFPVAENLITTIWYGILPQQDVAAPHVYGPLELKLTELKLASLAGLTIALPVAVYETYLFMRPGLYPNERRYYLAAVPTSLVLAIVGIGFAYFLVLPGLFTYFLYYSDVTANVAFGLRETFNLILTMMGMLAVVFQIPLFIMLATMMGITSREWLVDNRLLFWGAFLGIAFLFSPDPTGMAPLIVAVTMVGLYEGTLLLLRWVDR